MIIRQNAQQVAASLRHSVAGVRRVTLVQRDGTPFSDDGPEHTRDHFAALVIAGVEMAHHTAAGAELTGLATFTVKTDDGAVVATPVGDRFALAVVVDPGVNLVLLQRAMAPQVEHLLALDGGAVA
ncbi:roadblock/LC7 domain-containing protein [Cellulomonas triticagri]|uniref:roadblock/LC7 domain-containing protein n=1 Tax=Cellulomonas triticagri TaxID=2483352 RepID=UPI001315A881|nr:roadblock/LC7 domain-containing protein [Cellulomonas triticagri]